MSDKKEYDIVGVKFSDESTGEFKEDNFIILDDKHIKKFVKVLKLLGYRF